MDVRELAAALEVPLVEVVKEGDAWEWRLPELPAWQGRFGFRKRKALNVRVRFATWPFHKLPLALVVFQTTEHTVPVIANLSERPILRALHDVMKAGAFAVVVAPGSAGREAKILSRDASRLKSRLRTSTGSALSAASFVALAAYLDVKSHATAQKMRHLLGGYRGLSRLHAAVSSAAARP